MKKLIFYSLLFSMFLVSCLPDPKPRNEVSIIPESFNGRDNVDLGTVNINNTNVTISVWDHGQIDGDIVSIYVNGKLLVDQEVLDGPNFPITFSTDLEYSGYNYVLLYAHNEGSLPPNTCTILINDGEVDEEFELRSDLSTNGAVNIVVN
ncbi:hypothetical protein [Aquiflexum gelatinilyticum]|uniref:hypothetical protein n=1 Tax=Aquiflexum gelatinilyticum TaxID=2961943 RepID=UPI002169FD8F|nr:hypothetical protein [Aquiflexum gelatinilyticum]MCS4433070.1 hypothetical protein [Aquiflexum gelatinilyticum]